MLLNVIKTVSRIASISFAASVAYKGVQSKGFDIEQYTKEKLAVTGHSLIVQVKAIDGFAEVSDDKKYLYLSTKLDDIMYRLQMVLTNTTVEQVIDSLLAHELGHIDDPKLSELQTEIVSMHMNRLYNKRYYDLVIEREERARDIGLKHARFPKVYANVNKNNLRKYHSLLKVCL